MARHVELSRRHHHSPYLDVMTIQSRQYIAQKDWIEEEHTKLLVEPIHIPDLKHTGIQLHATTNTSTPMFYPNGMKNVHLRQVIKESLSFASPTSRSMPLFPLHSNTATVTIQPSIDSSMQPLPGDLTPPKSKPNSVKKPSKHKKQQNQRIYRELDKVRQRETKELLTNVRLNTNKIAGLVNPHHT